MTQIKIKPLSVNKVFQGRCFRTKEYDTYELLVLSKLPKMLIPEGKLRLELEVGFSNSASDIDNFVKPFLDILQKKYGFNDSRIYELVVTKTVVKKLNEYIKFEIIKI